MELAAIWFALIFILLAGYAVLDGFDLGVGSLHFLWRNDADRRIAINSIGPVWDGNEVWLLTAGGALFAAFPPVYATVFSGFYIALMLLLVALIGRAVAIEFRGKVEHATWQRVWDWVFLFGSFLPPLLLGVALGNIMRGVPIDGDGLFRGTFLGLLNPYAVLIGLLTVVLFMMHGALYLAGKSEGSQHTRLTRLVIPLWCAFAVLHLAAAIATAWSAGFLYEGIYRKIAFWPLVALWTAGLVSVPVFTVMKRYGWAFLGSSATVAAMVGLVAVALFPTLVPSSLGSSFSLTIHNSSSSQYTLRTMLIIALIGMPFVIGYTAFIYKVFKGKVVITEDSY